MSYDLAVWEGDRPRDDVEAGEMHSALYAKYVDTDEEFPPTPAIAEFVRELLAKWPDMGEEDDGDEEAPWSDGPMINNACGPYMYFGMSYSRADEASAYAVQAAARLRLHCYDPQMDQLRT